MAIGLKISQGDFEISNRKLVFVTGSDKASRDFSKFLVTEIEHAQNKTTFPRYNPNYGTELGRQDAYKNLSRSIIIDLMTDKLRQALKWYITIQESRNNLSLSEIMTALDFLVFNDVEDGRTVRVSITGTLGSGEDINIGEYSQKVV